MCVCVYQAFICGFFPLVHNSSKTLQKIPSMKSKTLLQLFMLQCLHLWSKLGCSCGFRNPPAIPSHLLFLSTQHWGKWLSSSSLNSLGERNIRKLTLCPRKAKFQNLSAQNVALWPLPQLGKHGTG